MPSAPRSRMSLQYGVPLEVLVNKFSHMRFEPMGHTTNPDIRIAKSVVDYIFRWLGNTFLPGFREASSGLAPGGPTSRRSTPTPATRRPWPTPTTAANHHATAERQRQESITPCWSVPAWR